VQPVASSASVNFVCDKGFTSPGESIYVEIAGVITTPPDSASSAMFWKYTLLNRFSLGELLKWCVESLNESSEEFLVQDPDGYLLSFSQHFENFSTVRDGICKTDKRPPNQ
jgi:hypothetical protein